MIVLTSKPKELWEKIKQEIADGTIDTWSLSDGKTFLTHKAPQWAKLAWFKPVVGNGMLTFNIIKPRGSSISTDVYAEYHALLLRMLLAHFDKWFSNAFITALAQSGDIVSKS